MHITVATIAAPAPRRGRLLCPICQDRRITPDSVACTSLLGQPGEARIDRDGLHLDPSAAPAEGGSAIAITCRCGQGHLFCLRLRSIYDTTTAETVALPFAIAAQDPGRN
jgi:hypothetical protein